MNFEIRIANLDDVDFMVQADIETDIEDTGDLSAFRDEEAIAHREKIQSFITDDDKGAWVAVDNNETIGTIFVRYRDYAEAAKSSHIFHEIGSEVFPEDGRFCEVFQLRVSANYRKKGIASHLKRHVEIDARLRDVKLIYTHTAIEHVVQMNLKLGYREVRRGTMWDETIRVSLVKDL